MVNFRILFKTAFRFPRSKWANRCGVWRRVFFILVWVVFDHPRNKIVENNGKKPRSSRWWTSDCVHCLRLLCFIGDRRRRRVVYFERSRIPREREKNRSFEGARRAMGTLTTAFAFQASHTFLTPFSSHRWSIKNARSEVKETRRFSIKKSTLQQKVRMRKVNDDEWMLLTYDARREGKEDGKHAISLVDRPGVVGKFRPPFCGQKTFMH